MQGFKKKKNPANKIKVSRPGEECNARGCAFECTNDTINMKEKNCSPNE